MPPATPAGPSIGTAITRTARIVVRNIGRHELSTRAAALTYGTLFSLVPTLAVAFAMFNAFGGIEQARDVLLPRLLDYVAVGSQAVVEEQIDGFVQNIHAGALGSIGTVVLLWAVVSLMIEMESSLDRVWDVPVGRSFFQRATMYWTTVTVTPTLVLSGLSLPPMLANVRGLSWLVEGAVGHLLLSVVLPLALVYLGFITLYLLVPNTRVTPRAALAGGVVGGSLWLVALSGYAYYASVSVTYSKIYGSLGALAVFLVWIYLTWLIVLIGAEIAAAVQLATRADDTLETADLSPAARELITVRVLSAVAARFLAGEAPPTAAEIADDTRQAPGLVTRTAFDLTRAGLLVEDAEQRFVPARDPHRISPGEALAALRQHGEPAPWPAADRVAERIAALGRRADDAWVTVWDETTLSQLVQSEAS